jgi:UDP-N-acetylmuramoyl-L-alanyl-D-glutamate--2,6-diaminopimelate ligase
MPSLKELLVAVPEARVLGDDNIEVSTLAYDSRQVAPGTGFVAVRGQAHDGHEFIPQALERGATAIVADNEEALASLPPGATGILVSDTRLALANLACEFYGHPSREMTLVGVTGTNGKTTTAHLIAELLRQAGYKSVGIIGTLGASTERATLDTGRTTPESLDLQRLLADFLDGGSEAVVMEVSSHALAMQRVAGCAFDAGVFTNLTQDHLDFHKDMDDYFAAKAKLFDEVARYSEQFKSFGAVLNVDDHYGRRLRDEVSSDSYISLTASRTKRTLPPKPSISRRRACRLWRGVPAQPFILTCISSDASTCITRWRRSALACSRRCHRPKFKPRSRRPLHPKAAWK